MTLGPFVNADDGPGGVAAYDPLGNYVRHYAPAGSPTDFHGPSSEGAWSTFTNPTNLSTGCTLDGALGDCNRVRQALQAGWVGHMQIYSTGLADLPGMGFVPQPITDSQREREVNMDGKFNLLFMGLHGQTGPAGPVVDSSDLGDPPPVPQNPNCIENAVAGGKLGATRNLIPEISAASGKPVLTGRAAHNGIHIYAPPGASSPVTALPAMGGQILWANRQGEKGTVDYNLGVMDILLNTRINGRQYVLTLMDVNYADMQKGGNVRPGSVIGSVEGSENRVGETGLHVSLYPYSVYEDKMRNKPNGRKRLSIPFSAFMDAARNPASPFRCRPYYNGS